MDNYGIVGARDCPGSSERWTKGDDKKTAKGIRRRIIIVMPMPATVVAFSFIVQSLKGAPIYSSRNWAKLPL